MDIMECKSVSNEQKKLVKKWWDSFRFQKEKIVAYFASRNRSDFDLAKWVQDNLQSIDGNLMWEFGPGLEKVHRLVITPESNRHLRPLVRYILQAAPEFMEFEFYEYRFSETLEATAVMMANRTNWLDISQIEFDAQIGLYNRVDIVYYTPFNELDKVQLNKLFLLTEQLLGEEMVEQWLGILDVKPLPKGLFKKKKGQYSSINQLKSEFDNLMAGLKRLLPDKLYFETAGDGNWVLLELKPDQKNDYKYKDDLFVSPFISESLFTALHTGRESFYSGRYSKHEEEFIYLKMDGSASDLNQEVFEDRSSIEDALNMALNRKGCVIGGGTGYRYSYIDLAVTDLSESVQIIQRLLQKGHLTKSSWILFHNPDYQSEWIGIWEDSPAPFIDRSE